MKKIIYFIIINLIFIPIVYAKYEVTDYRININVLSNGDLEIEEAFKLDGLYNGYERIIDYKNNYDNYYGENLVSIDKKLYDASNLKIEEVRAINFNYNEFSEFRKYGDLFELKDDAKKGEHGIYKIVKTETGEKIKIYNPSNMNKDFYLKYTLKNVLIKHNDVSELAMFIFTKLNENINNLEITINLKENSNILNVWTHNNSNINIINKNKIIIKKKNVLKYEKFDFRLIFDNYIKTNKITKENITNKILKIEENFKNNNFDKIDKEYLNLQEKAYTLVNLSEKTNNRIDYNNAMNEVIKLNTNDKLKTKLLVRLINIESKVERKEVIIKVFYTSILTMWILGLFILIYHFIKKFDNNVKNYESSFKKERPAIFGYLINKRITNDDLIAEFLYLINNKNIECIKTSKDYKFKILNTKNLPNSSDKLIKFIFGNEEQISFNKLQKKSKKDYDNYLKLYSNWIDAISCEVQNKKYYFNLFSFKLTIIIYSIIGIIIGGLLIFKSTYFSSVIIIFLSILLLIMTILLKKKTKYGKTQYNHLRNYLIKKDYEFIDYLYVLSAGKFDKYFKYSDNKEIIFINDVRKIIKQSLKNAYEIKKDK